MARDDEEEARPGGRLRCRRCGGGLKRGVQHKSCRSKRAAEPTRPRSVSLRDTHWAKIEKLRVQWGLRSRSAVVARLVEKAKLMEKARLTE